jgi:hypothetical protein
MVDFLILWGTGVCSLLGCLFVAHAAYKLGFADGELQQLQRCIQDLDEIAERRVQRLLSNWKADQEQHKAMQCDRENDESKRETGYFAARRRAHPIKLGDTIDGKRVVMTAWRWKPGIGDVPIYRLDGENDARELSK